MKERPNVLTEHSVAARRMAYLVSLQFTIPGTIALLAQVAPHQQALWRTSFAAIFGAAGVLFLGSSVRQLRGHAATARVLRWAVLPVYIAIAVVAAVEPLPEKLGLTLSSIEIEGVLLALLVFLGAHLAWVTAPSATSTGAA